jgi:hypothetical protein
MDAGCLFAGLMLPGLEADHSPPSRTEVKIMWSYTFTSAYIFMVWGLFNHRIHLHSSYVLSWTTLFCAGGGDDDAVSDVRNISTF